MPVGKPKIKAPDKTPEAKARLKGCLSHLPSLLAHCTAATYSDGSARQPGTLTIGSHSGAWRVTARDNALGVQVSVTDADLDTALAAIDNLVGDENTQWEVNQWSGKKAKRKS